MSLTLNDNLCVRWVERKVDPDANPAYEDNVTLRGRHRPATLDDLVEVLESLGGEVRATSILNIPDPIRVITIGGPSGRYLVVPIPEASE